MTFEEVKSTFGIKFSQVMEIDDDGGDITVMFPGTSHFIKGIEQKKMNPREE